MKAGNHDRIGGLVAAVAIAATLVALPVQAQDQGQFGAVIRIESNAFAADAGLITFSEFDLSSKNPTYTPARYGARESGVTVRFGGFFLGQQIAAAYQCPEGASRSGCISGVPVAPLRLDPRAPVTFIEKDGSNPNSPSLSGTPRFNGAVTMLFDRDIAGIGLAGGYFNAKRTTAIQAFDRNGNLIGGVKNIGIGMEYLALVTEDGANRIAGVQFSLVGPEPAGYAIDDLSFALADQILMEQVPGLAETLLEPRPAAEQPKGSLSDLFAAEPKADDGGAGAGGGSLTDIFTD